MAGLPVWDILTLETTALRFLLSLNTTLPGPGELYNYPALVRMENILFIEYPARSILAEPHISLGLEVS